MFFNAHAYYSMAKNKGDTEPMRLMGALLPDSAITGVVGWDTLHDKHTLEAFIGSLGAGNQALGLGLMDHYDLDLRSHNQYKGEGGYAYSHQTEQLRELVATACGLDSAEKAKGLAHNFIEAGVDIHLLRQDPSIQDKTHEALRTVDVASIAEDLSSFLAIDTADTQARLRAYIDLLLRYDLRETEGWIDIWAEIALLLLGNQIDLQATREALSLAVDLTAQDYRQVITP